MAFCTFKTTRECGFIDILFVKKEQREYTPNTKVVGLNIIPPNDHPTLDRRIPPNLPLNRNGQKIFGKAYMAKSISKPNMRNNNHKLEYKHMAPKQTESPQ